MTISDLHEVYRRKLFVNIKNKEQFLKLIEKKLTNKQSKKVDIYFYIYIGSIYFTFIDHAFLEALKSATYVHLDGFPTGWVIKTLFGRKVTGFNASDHLRDLFSLCQKQKKRIFLLGSDTNNISKAIGKIRKEYPYLNVSGYHGYFTQDYQAINSINKFKPDFLVLGLGLGKQEKWINQNYQNLKTVKVALTVGNFIDILGNKTKLPPEITKKLKLRWLYRLLKEPGRLWKRYFLGVVFLSILVLYTILAKLTTLILRKIKS